MTQRVSLHAEATAELEAAAFWYEEQRDGLGLQFLAAVDRSIQQALAWPLAGPAVEGLPAELAVRRTSVPRFPYHVAYMTTDNGIDVLAVAHDHRRPGYWKRRTGPNPI